MKKRYTVYWIGGERDNKIIGTFESKRDAIKAAEGCLEAHGGELDPVRGGVGIDGITGNSRLSCDRQ